MADKLKEELKKITNKEVQINISETKRPELDAVLVASTIARQIEGRISYRRAMKTAISSSIRMGAEGIKVLVKTAGPNTEFIAVSSSSALKGSGIEGIGYPSSKAALSIAFESLPQKYQGKYIFKTIYFGPINSGMSPFKKNSFFMLSEKQAVEKIIQASLGKKVVYYYPAVLFFILKIVKLFPSKIYFYLLSQMEGFHKKRC